MPIVEPGMMLPGTCTQVPGATVMAPVAPAAPVTVNVALPVQVANAFVPATLQIFRFDSASKNGTRVSTPAVADRVMSRVTPLLVTAGWVVAPACTATTSVMNTPVPVSVTERGPAGAIIGALH